MTISRDGVRMTEQRPAHWMKLLALIAVEAVLSLFVYVSFAAHALWPDDSEAAAGVSSVLSYEGRLMDASGNPLGGTGTSYCFRFSIYDAATSGTKLWPAGTPATTMATSTDGVFSALIGQADSLTYNFYDSDTTYLNVEVNTTPTTCAGSWETLSPRQQIAATGYARSAANVYSSLLFTDNSNSRVQIGAGTGGASPKLLGLDVKNTNDYIGQSCSTSGTVWYNSAISKALVCENGVIQAISNSSATTTLAAINANTGTPATTGTIVFSNSNGVTFGINGNTITASVNAGGAGSINVFSPSYPLGTTSQTQGAMGVTTASAMFYPVIIPNNIAFNVLQVVQSLSFVTATGTGQQTIRSTFGLFSNNAGTLSLISSNSLSLALTNNSVSATVSYASATATTGYGYGTLSASTTANIQSSFGTVGNRLVGLQFGNSMSLSGGVYWLGVLQRQSSSGSNIGLSTAMIGNTINSGVYAGLANIGNVSNATNYTLRLPFAGLGPYTSTGSAGYGGTALPSSVFLSGISHTGSVIPLMTFAST